MRKLYFLSLLFLSFGLFAQNLAVNGGMENWTGGVIDTWQIDTANGITVAEETTTFSEGSKSAMFTVTTQAQADTDFRQTINVVAGVTYDISVDVYALDNEARARLYADGYINTYSDDTLLNQWQTISNTFTAAVTGTIEIGLRFYDTSANWTGNGSVMYIDNFVFEAQATPSITVLSPADGSSTLDSSVDVELSVQNFQVGATSAGLDGHIHYTITTDGVAGSNVMKYDTNPITVPVTAGSTYTVDLELVDNSHNPLSPAVTTSVTSAASITSVTDLAALRADYIADPAAGADKYYQVATAPVITYSRANRNQKYIQDTSAGIVIDDDAAIMPYNDGTGTGPIDGDALSGLVGQVTTYGGVLQFVPVQTATVASSGNVITPEVVTIADITSNQANYESELVQITGVTFAAGDGTATFTSSMDYDITDTTTMVFRTIFSEADYVVNADIIPSTTDLVVLVAQWNGTPQVAARSIADIEALDTRAFNAIDGLTMYPNPIANGNVLNITSAANTSEMTIQIFDILGKEVINSTNNNIEVANLNSGVYIVKIAQDGKTATRKLVVK